MFSDRLKELRRKKNITQAQLAESLNITKGAIAMWETNKRTPDIDMVGVVADYFNVSVDYLLSRNVTNNDDSDDIKFALFNGSDGVTDEMFDEVKRFAEMVKLREDAKKGK